MSLTEILGDNAGILSPEETKGAEALVAAGQQHLIANWPSKGTEDAGKKQLCAQAARLDSVVAGGIAGYASRARKLLASSAEGENPYDGYKPTVPIGERLESESKEGLDRFKEMESHGVQEAAHAGFVMVAGGLGERLGYNGIKIDLPSETVTDTKYIELYIQNILAFQEDARAQTGNNELVLPFCIMVSDDTDAKTRAVLAANNNFGMTDAQLTIVKQELVPSLLNNDAHFATLKGDPYTIETKPHGHGDVHELLYSSGTLAKWVETGTKWVVFFQDTNGLVFRALPAALGVSKSKDLSVNSFTVPRRPGEAVGAIVRLEGKEHSMTINVEYNQIVPLMDACGMKEPASGFSPFPGNINVLVFGAEEFLGVLERTKGIIAEFVNPKYADAAKTTFKKPTRLECMMQDYPKLLGPESNVGFTQLERWTSFSAVKNNVVDAVDKQRDTGYAESAATGEADMYYANRKILSFAGVDVDVDGDEISFADIKVKSGAKVVMHPRFGTTLASVASKVPGGAAVKISKESTLVINAKDVLFESMQLAGALVLNVAGGAKVTIKDLVVKNDGYQFGPLPANAPEELAIRGYSMDKKAAVVIDVESDGVLTGEIAPGSYTLNGDTLKCTA